MFADRVLVLEIFLDFFAGDALMASNKGLLISGSHVFVASVHNRVVIAGSLILTFEFCFRTFG